MVIRFRRANSRERGRKRVLEFDVKVIAGKWLDELKRLLSRLAGLFLSDTDT